LSGAGASIDWDALVAAAWRVRELAYAPYSRYLVGAALLADDGRVFVGANVENASYGLCLCAERAAIGSAIAAGARHFAAIAVVTQGSEPGTPCGMCRQVLAEFAPAFPVRCVAEGGARLDSTTEALLPFAFTPAALGVDTEGARSTMVLGTSDRFDTDRPPPADPVARPSVTGGAFAGVALKVAAGTGSELADVDVTRAEADGERGDT
jgi:cytidine deaminase